MAPRHITTYLVKYNKLTTFTVLDKQWWWSEFATIKIAITKVKEMSLK